MELVQRSADFILQIKSEKHCYIILTSFCRHNKKIFDTFASRDGILHGNWDYWIGKTIVRKCVDSLYPSLWRCLQKEDQYIKIEWFLKKKVFFDGIHFEQWSSFISKNKCIKVLNLKFPFKIFRLGDLFSQHKLAL